MDQDFVRQMRKKVEEELRKKEREVLEYWRLELDKIMKKRRGNLAALIGDLENLQKRMETRLKKV